MIITLLKKLGKAYNKLRGFLPSPIPVGINEFNGWVDSIINTYEMPTQDRDSIEYALATMVLHLGATQSYKPKWYFVLCLRSAAAKQIAGAKFVELKEKQEKLRKQAEEDNKPKTEATVKLISVANEKAQTKN